MNNKIIAFPAEQGKMETKKKKSAPQGLLVISVKLGTGCYRHLKLPQEATLEELADAILWAFDFDNDHAHAYFMDNQKWSDTNAYYMAEVDEEDEFPHTCDYTLTVLHVGQKFKFVFDFGDEWVFDCTVLREVAGNDSDEVEIVRQKGAPPLQYGDYEEDWDEEEPGDDDEK